MPTRVSVSSLLKSERSFDMIDHLGLSSLFSLSYNQKPVLGNETNSSIVMKGWYKTFFPNVSNDAFSCSDHFSFVKGHYKLYVHIKQRYISLGGHIRITVLWFPPDVWTFAQEAFAIFFIVDIQMELNQEFLVRRRKKAKLCKPKEPVIVSDNFPMWLLPHPCQSHVIRNKVFFMINALG